MSITTELREWARDNTVQGEVLTTHPVQHPVHGTLESLLEIADRIDAEHESKVSYWQDASYKDGYDEGFASADDYFTDKRETLKEHGWVKLPVDADGVPIHVGDVMETPRGNVLTVTGIMCELGKWTVNGWTPAYLRRHEPTVEDVLEGFARAYDDIGGRPDEDELWGKLLAEYASKLRLKEDE